MLVVGGRPWRRVRSSAGDLLSFYAIVALLQGQVSTITALVPVTIWAGSGLTVSTRS